MNCFGSNFLLLNIFKHFRVVGLFLFVLYGEIYFLFLYLTRCIIAVVIAANYTCEVQSFEEWPEGQSGL